MSYSVSLNMKLETNSFHNCKEIINLLIKSGWNVQREGKITFLPLNDDDMFEWTTSKICLNDFIKLVDEKEHMKELVGVELYWENTDIGGHLLMSDNRNFLFVLNINTKYIEEKIKIPNYNWYAERIIPYIQQEYHIIEYNFEYTY